MPVSNNGKATNPKDAVAGTKVPLDLLSPVAMAHWAAGQHAGNAKYGLVNYRVCGASARVYLGGALRHIQRYLAGQRLDPQDQVHNLGMAMANLAIVLDCEAAGTLNDDRPYAVSLDPTYAEVEAQVKASNARYADRKPKHYTIQHVESATSPGPEASKSDWIKNNGVKPKTLPEKIDIVFGDDYRVDGLPSIDWSWKFTGRADDIRLWRPA